MDVLDGSRDPGRVGAGDDEIVHEGDDVHRLTSLGVQLDEHTLVVCCRVEAVLGQLGLDGADGRVAGLFGRKVVPRAAERRRCASP